MPSAALICLEWRRQTRSKANPHQRGVGVQKLIDLPVREQIGRFKYTLPDQVKETFTQVMARLDQELNEAKQTKEDF